MYEIYIDEADTMINETTPNHGEKLVSLSYTP